MDNKKKIQSGSSRKNIDNIIRDYRRKQTLFVIGTAVTNALIAAFLTIYYSIRQRALVGALPESFLEALEESFLLPH